MSADAAVVSAIYDSYDTVKPVCPQRGLDVEWILVTDDPDLRAPGWTVVYEPRPGMHPNRAAKGPKFRPDRYTSAPASVWVDASFRVTSPTFVMEALSYADPIAQFVHPWRDCVYTEAEASADLPKYWGEPIEGQAKYYRAAGHPEHWGLWATGVIARKHTLRTAKMGALWGQEVNVWSFQDQLSQPYVLWTMDLRPTSLPGTHFANDWLAYEGSGRH